MPWRSPFLVVCCLAASSAIAFPADSPAKHATNETLTQHLDHIIIPKMEFREVPFREALDFLLHEAQRLDPKGRGINTTVRLEAPGAGAPVVPGLPPPSEPAPADSPGMHGTPVIAVVPKEPRITVSVSKIPFSEALSYITGLAKLKWRVVGNVVQIVSESEPDPVREKASAFRQPSSQSPTKRSAGRAPRCTPCW